LAKLPAQKSVLNPSSRTATHLQLSTAIKSQPYFRRIFLGLLPSVATLIGTISASAAPAHPNIVYILCDDLGYGDVRCLNPQGKIATPNMDSIAAGGMRFTDARSSSAVCTPTRYSLLTGRYNWRPPMKKGVLNGYSPRLIETGRATVAAFLKEQGYATAYITRDPKNSKQAAKKPENTAIPVTVSAEHGMTRGGKPYFVKGAGGETRLELLAARGANSIRTWSTGSLETTLDKAALLNLTVSAGIWLEPECSWFSYSNPLHCAKQLERVKTEVLAYRNHPALLAWGIGNESEGDGTSAAYWQQLDKLAVMVKELDPAHPTFTAVAGLNPAKTKGLNEHTPHLDFVGVNTYGGVFGLRKHLEKVGWTRPWMLTEWGPQGFWESPKNPSGAPLEQTSSEKAAMIARAYDQVISKRGSCLGSYVFVWSWKFEATATWFGLFTNDGKTTESVDVLEEKWSGTKPVNRAPTLQAIKGVPAGTIAPGTTFSAKAVASDPEGDPLSWQWAVLREALTAHHAKTVAMPAAVKDTIVSATENRATVKTPSKPGDYRLYLWIGDGKGHAATANVPFTVK